MTPRPLNEDARARGRDQAIAARRRRAHIKKALAHGEISLASVLAQRSDQVISKFRIGDLILSLRGFGAAKTDALMADVGIDPQRRLGQLGEHQIVRIVQHVNARAKTSRPAPRARLLVLSGPSGVGKSSVVGYLRED